MNIYRGAHSYQLGELGLVKSLPIYKRGKAQDLSYSAFMKSSNVKKLPIDFSDSRETFKAKMKTRETALTAQKQTAAKTAKTVAKQEKKEKVKQEKKDMKEKVKQEKKDMKEKVKQEKKDMKEKVKQEKKAMKANSA